jgi:hypothetical protein
VPLLNSSGLVPSANGGASTGDVKFNMGTSLAGWVLCAGTIGDAASNATNRANADTSALFTLLWTVGSDTTLPIYTSGGILSTRGGSAAIDFAADKAVSVPDLRGRVVAGLDNMVLGAAGRLTSTTMTPAGNTTAATGGAQTHTPTLTAQSMTIAQIAGAFTVSATGNAAASAAEVAAAVSGTGASSVSHDHAVTATGSTTGGSITGQVSGSTDSVITVQPTLVMNAFIKL